MQLIAIAALCGLAVAIPGLDGYGGKQTQDCHTTKTCKAVYSSYTKYVPVTKYITTTEYKPVVYTKDVPSVYDTTKTVTLTTHTSSYSTKVVCTTTSVAIPCDKTYETISTCKATTYEKQPFTTQSPCPKVITQTTQTPSVCTTMSTACTDTTTCDGNNLPYAYPTKKGY